MWMCDCVEIKIQLSNLWNYQDTYASEVNII